MRLLGLLLLVLCCTIRGHDAHGRSNTPIEARRLRSPLPSSPEHTEAGRIVYEQACASCHGADGKARTKLAGSMPVRPTDLSNYLMESMKDGEIFWVATHGIEGRMPGFEQSLDETKRWELVQHVRELRNKQRAVEVADLGSYKWNLPPGFPYPNVPPDNPMTAEKVELGRYLFYDKRLSLNRNQSCGSCHRQDHAFADARAHGFGSTGEYHPRGPMSLVNVAYSPVLTWANPNMRSLEKQALVPMFGEDPVELGMSGKEDVLIRRLKAEPRYKTMFARAFSEPDPFTLANITKAIASFERTLLSGDSPYDHYRRGDDPAAITESAKRGETLFFSEKLECFHCHGGFNFTGTLDYYGKGIAEVEFHNTGLYNLKGELSYPQPNLGLYIFTQSSEDVGKFKAPTLRNIALTAPYMHDGSVKTLTESIDHYAAGGRKIATGAKAGDGSQNPAKSEFVKGFQLSTSEKRDLLAFLGSLTDTSLLANPLLSDPWTQHSTNAAPPSTRFRLTGNVVKVFPEDSSIALTHDAVPGLIGAMKAPLSMEFLVDDAASVKDLKPGANVIAWVERRGTDYVLSGLKLTPGR
jgi:cytochrome c peroxidase